jgi:hypothetical protein
MPTSTYIALGTATFTSDSSITFSSIPATYRDLVVIVSCSNSGTSNLSMRFNGDTGSNYTMLRMFAFSGGGPTTDYYTGDKSEGGNIFAEQFLVHANILDYSATNKHKIILSRNAASGTSVFYHSNRWANTNAINQIEVFPNAGSLTGTISLYGIVS